MEVTNLPIKKSSLTDNMPAAREARRKRRFGVARQFNRRLRNLGQMIETLRRK